jgi:hypothetical protein
MPISLEEHPGEAMSKSRYPAPEHYALATSKWRQHVSTFNVEEEEPIEAAVSWLQHLKSSDPALYARFMADAEAWVSDEFTHLHDEDGPAPRVDSEPLHV